MNRRGFEFSFGWIFAAIAGAAIIFIAIYLTTNIINQGNQLNSATAGLEISALLSPVETVGESGRVNQILLGEPTRIYLSCNPSGEFGFQEISVSVSSSLGKKWEKPTTTTKLQNKYIFANNLLEGKKLLVLSNKFEFPFKIADIITLVSDKDSYCFVRASEKIIQDLNLSDFSNIQIVTSLAQCGRESTKVCFNNQGCDFEVSLNSKTITKRGTTIYYGVQDANFGEEDSLLYGAIFSDPEVFECQLKRLTKRMAILSDIYKEKEEIISRSGCNSNIGSELDSLYMGASSFSSSQDLRQIALSAKEVENKNNVQQSCKLY